TPRPPIAPTPSARVSAGTSAGASGSPLVPKASASAAGSFAASGVTVSVQGAATAPDSPVDVANAGYGSGRLFVVEQAGRIRVVRDGALVARPFLDISDRVSTGGERGLLGLAFHPGYPTDPRFFVDYTDTYGNTVVSSFRVSATEPDQADPASETILLHVTQ